MVLSAVVSSSIFSPLFCFLPPLGILIHQSLEFLDLTSIDHLVFHIFCLFYVEIWEDS